MRNIYILSIGKIYRKSNNLYFIDKDKNKRVIPIEGINAMYIMNKVSLTSNAIQMILNKGVPVHFFKEDSKTGIFYYLGSLLPKQRKPSGKVHIEQVKAYLNVEKRSEIALEIVDAMRYNMVKVIEKYREVYDYTKTLRNLDVRKEFEQKITDWKDAINVIRGIESNIWVIFYEALDKVLKTYKLERRTKRPPKNEANTILSFSNALLYATVLNEIYKTHLDPTIGFLHEPYEKGRFSLALDLAEPFKPIISCRILIWLINQGIIKPEHFKKDLMGVMLNENGRRVVIKEFEKRIKETIKIKGRGRKSMLTFIRKQAYNLERALVEDTKFKAFRLVY